MQAMVATWGVLLVLGMLGQALWKLTPVALEPWRDGSMSVAQQLLYVGFVVFNAYAEGYRGFQKRFSPRVVGRAFHLGANPRPLYVALALPFCLSLFHAQRRQRIVSWVFLVGLVALIIAVRQLPQPWRGIIDGGVVVGLAWGAASIVAFWWRGVRGAPPPATDLPDRATPAEA
ncbi:MAG: hypothetical protein KF901_17470 [Myxococcales bacterium]|nr:hypothetical protein [Myxococcales bacterium]